MRATVVYESMFGATRTIATAIADGLANCGDVEIIRVSDLQPGDLDASTLLVVGGPTHARSLSRPATREDAAKQATRADRGLTLEPGADRPGLREWLSGDLPPLPAASFDTRARMPRLASGSAAVRIARSLRRHGCSLVAAPESFFVTKTQELMSGEVERARFWGSQIGRRLNVDGRSAPTAVGPTPAPEIPTTWPDSILASPAADDTDSNAVTAARLALQRAVDFPRDCVAAEVHERVLTLTGNVATPGERVAAERAVRHVPGVVGIDNRIKVGTG